MFKLAWEPRGDWLSHEKTTSAICSENDLIHCTDPFKSLPVEEAEDFYFRLHGKPPGEEMYKYTFTEGDLTHLREMLEGLSARRHYVLWNNYNMYEDLKRFQALIG